MTDIAANSTATPALAAAHLLDAPQAELAQIFSSAALVTELPVRRFALRGADRFRWLSGMVTNMVNDLAPNSGAYNFVLNSQGRIQGDLEVWRTAEQEDTVELAIEATQADKLLAHFDRFIIMDDVEILPIDGSTALTIIGPEAINTLSKLGTEVAAAAASLTAPLTQSSSTWQGSPILVRRAYSSLVPRLELWIDSARSAELSAALQSAGATEVSSAALEVLRVLEATPRYGIDLVEKDLPQETSQLRALHFNKGCYQGQEIVERIRSRGNVHRHLRQLELTGFTNQTSVEVQLNGTVVGHATSIATLGLRTFALAIVRAEAELPGKDLSWANGKVTLLAEPPTIESLTKALLKQAIQ